MDTESLNETGNEVTDANLVEAAQKTAEAPAEIDYSKIDYTKLDAAKLPPHIVQASPHFQGVLGELQDTRGKVKDQAEAIQSLTEELQEKDKDKDLVENADEPATIGTVAKLIDNKLNKLADKIEGKRKKETQTVQAQTRQQILTNSSLRLEQEVTAEKAGEGLDATTVIAEGIPWLKTHRPYLFNAAVANSDDPAREIYELAINLVPTIRQRAETRKNQLFVTQLNSGRIPKGGGVIPQAAQKRNAILELLNLNDEEIVARAEQEETSEQE